MFEYLGGDRRRRRHGIRAFAREVDIGDARVFVDHGFQWDGTRNVWLTRARAYYVLEAGPVFELKPRALLARVTGLFGGTPSGDPCFDDFFTVRTAAAEETWSALTTRVRSILAGSFEDARLISDGRMVTLWRSGDFGYESDAAAAIEAVADIVHHKSEILDNLRTLPGATACDAAGAWDERRAPGAIVDVPTPVRLRARAGQWGPVMSASSDCGRAVPRFEVSVDDAGRVRRDVLGMFRTTHFHSDASHSLGPCDIRCDGHQVVLVWRELDVAHARLQEGAHLVASLSGLSTGFYR